MSHQSEKNFPKLWSSWLKSSSEHLLTAQGESTVSGWFHPPLRVQSQGGVCGATLGSHCIIFVTSCPWIKENTESEIRGQEVIYYSELFMQAYFPIIQNWVFWTIERLRHPCFHSSKYGNNHKNHFEWKFNFLDSEDHIRPLQALESWFW